jgi:hypothetical protein
MIILPNNANNIHATTGGYIGVPVTNNSPTFNPVTVDLPSPGHAIKATVNNNLLPTNSYNPSRSSDQVTLPDPAYKPTHV